MPENFRNFQQKAGAFLHETLQQFSGVDLTPKQKESHLKRLISALNIQSGGATFHDVRPIRNISNRDKILAFDIANFFAQKEDFDLRNLEEVREKFLQFTEKEVIPVEYSQAIYNCTAGNKEAIESFLRDLKKDEQPILEFSGDQRQNYDRYFKESAKVLMKKIIQFLVKCEDLKPALEEYCKESQALQQRLESGEKLNFIDRVKAQSAIPTLQNPAPEMSPRYGTQIEGKATSSTMTLER